MPSSSNSSWNTHDSIYAAVTTVTVLVLVALLIWHAKTRPMKLPEFSISEFAVTSLDSNSSSAITVGLQIESQCQYYVTYNTMSVYVLKNGSLISEVSMPPSEQETGQTLWLKARMVVPNGGGVGFNYWSGTRVLDFDVRVTAKVGIDGFKELRVTCDGIKVGFEKGRAGSMVAHLNHCLVYGEERIYVGGREEDPD